MQFIFLKKYFDFETSVIKWFDSYLSNRKFLVYIEIFFLSLEYESMLYHKALFLDSSFFSYI